jgi:hypothetical protein
MSVARPVAVSAPSEKAGENVVITFVMMIPPIPNAPAFAITVRL